MANEYLNKTGLELYHNKVKKELNTIKTNLKEKELDISNLKTNKVDKVEGKGLSTNDFTNDDKEKIKKISGVESTINELKINKVDKVPGKGLSTNDYDNAAKLEVGKIKDKISTNDLINKVYPIGSIYISVANTNPSSFIGGGWERFANGRVLVGVEESEEEFNTPKKTGGEKLHELTIPEMPTHTHKITTQINATAFGTGNLSRGNAEEAEVEEQNKPPHIFSEGGSKPHNNLQPYITAYMWVRIS